MTINPDITDEYVVASLNAALTINISAPGDTNNGDLIEVRINANAAGYGLTWGAAGATISATATSINLPATTVANQILRILLEYNSAATEWECIAVV